MTAMVERWEAASQTGEERARNRFPARRAFAAALAEVSMQESQALSRATAEAFARRRHDEAARLRDQA